MLSNFILASKDMPNNFKSGNWDAFPDGYESIIKRHGIWPKMLRNAITLGFNDNLIPISNERFKDGNTDLWKKMKTGEFPDLVSEKFSEENKKRASLAIRRLAFATDPEYVFNNCLSTTGSPVILKIRFKDEKNNERIFNYNEHDHDDIYHSWFIVNHLNHLKVPNPIICEIGAGYGGVVSKIKANFSESKIIILDIPEVNAAQAYYLANVFPDKKFLGYKDFKTHGPKIVDMEFDFLILPGWTASAILKKKAIDAFINIRSMMEMEKTVIDEYFKIIHKGLKIGGLFTCINRYEKPVFKSINAVTELNSMKNYPFDEYWSPVISQPSEVQPHIHVLIAKRESDKPQYPFIETLKTIRLNPYRFMK